MIRVRQGIRLVAALAIAAALARWLSVHVALGWLAIVLCAFVGYHSYYLWRLSEWAALPAKRGVPTGSGSWGIAFERIARFVRDQSDSREALEVELSGVHAAVDRLPDALIALDRFDHVLWSNRAAQELHGIFGTKRPIHHFLRQPEFIAFLEEGKYDAPLRITLPEHPGRIYRIRIYPSAGGKLMITRDVTDQTKVDAMRSDFVANVSHELRTPVTIVGGFAETLLEIDLDEATRREHLESILRSSRTMQGIIDDLLTLSTLEADLDQPREELIELPELYEAMVEEARAFSGGKHRITLSIRDPQRVRGDRGQIESAIRNLLTNAVRYTPAGGEIELSWRVRDDEGWITVRDTGIGIEPEHLPRLAERFYRIDRGRSRSTGGTGLGLAIVKHIAARHGAGLHITSRPGEGSAFSLRLPATRLLPADDEA